MTYINITSFFSNLVFQDNWNINIFCLYFQIQFMKFRIDRILKLWLCLEDFFAACVEKLSENLEVYMPMRDLNVANYPNIVANSVVTGLIEFLILKGTLKDIILRITTKNNYNYSYFFILSLHDMELRKQLPSKFK